METSFENVFSIGSVAMNEHIVNMKTKYNTKRENPSKNIYIRFYYVQNC